LGLTKTTHHLKARLRPFGPSLIAPTDPKDRHDSNQHQVDVEDGKAHHVQGPSTHEVHEVKVAKVGDQLQPRCSEAQLERSGLVDARLLKDIYGVVGEDVPASVLEKPSEDSDLGSSKIGPAEQVSPP
jgi:hypothetical protein